MYLQSIELIETLPCLSEPGKITVVGRPSLLLDEVMPYLATLPGVISYNPEACTLTFHRRSGFLSLYAHRVYITQVADLKEGLELLASLAEAINATWSHRQELKPAQTARRAPRMLDVWSLLPKSNCKRCGEATCMAFAAALIQRRLTLADCPPLNDDAVRSGQRLSLEAML